MNAHTDPRRLDYIRAPQKRPEDCKLYMDVEMLARHFHVKMSDGLKVYLLDFAYQCELEIHRRSQIRSRCPFVGYLSIEGKIHMMPHNGISPCICDWEGKSDDRKD